MLTDLTLSKKLRLKFHEKLTNRKVASRSLFVKPMEKIAMNEEGEVVLIALESFTMLSILINFFCFLVMLEDKIVEAWICLGHVDHLLIVKWELF